MQNLAELKSLLSSPKKVAIIPHRKPDADALGSCLALSIYLQKKGHTTFVISPTDYPEFLNWMPGNEEVVIFDEDQTLAETLFFEADLIFCLDFSGVNRVESMQPLLVNAQQPIVVIDHHQGKEDFAQFELWDTKAAATAELIFDFIQMMGDSSLLDIPIAENIYAGIMTDTGSFKFSSTSSKIHRIVADLKDLGIDSARIHHLVYDTSSEDRLRFLGFALSEKLVVLPEYNAAYFAISAEELDRFSSRTGDTEGLVNYALSVKGISIAALFTERKEGGAKMSFRSIGDFSVAEIANKYFGGGGHKNAAGGMITDKSLDEIVQLFKEVLQKYPYPS